ncbi:MAG: polysaccharide pyruvyl transferase family protein [Muribaculum sp.]|nr:polysaccharide pyruvyl transferase family protein [Muribaculum sp.]
MKLQKLIKYTHAFLNKGANKDPHPIILSYLITSYCNSHCMTCNVWKDKLSVNRIDTSKLKRIVSSDLFSKIEHVGISGGEPSTFEELFSHIKVLADSLPRLQTISITSNCINHTFWEQNLAEIYSFLKSKNIYFQINISLDGIGESHEKIRGTKGNFESFVKVLNFVKSESIPYQIHTTVNRNNVYELPAILHFAKRNDSQIIFRLASTISRLHNTSLIPNLELDEAQISFFCDFINSPAVRSISSTSRRLFYKSLSKQLLSTTKERIANCYFKQQGVVLASDGTVSHCSRFSNGKNILDLSENEVCGFFYDENQNESSVTDICTRCYHDQSGYWTPKEIIKDNLPSVVQRAVKVKSIIRYLSKKFRSLPNVRNEIQKVCIIGMYGGEHVGDAAILGGVLYRLKSRYPQIKEVTVYSFRADRTCMWVKSLTKFSDLKIKVIWREREFINSIESSDILVWAGGPIMNIPVVLSRNYLFIKKACACNIPVEIEGVGYGPLGSKFSRWISAKIFKSARYVSCRSVADLEKLLRLHTPTQVNWQKDPAFDYLKLLNADDLPELDRKLKIDKLIEQLGGGTKVAINLRPLWNKYGEDFSVDSFWNKFAHDIDLLIEKDIQVVFYPMNSDQFGFSDLNVALELKDKLKNPRGFHILYTEPTINEIIYLLRKVDYAVSMRFHGAIFALSQGINTIGLDYDLSKEKKGKIANLFDYNPGTYINIAEFENGDLLSIILK